MNILELIDTSSNDFVIIDAQSKNQIGTINRTIKQLSNEFKSNAGEDVSFEGITINHEGVTHVFETLDDGLIKIFGEDVAYSIKHDPSVSTRPFTFHFLAVSGYNIIPCSSYVEAELRFNHFLRNSDSFKCTRIVWYALIWSPKWSNTNLGTSKYMVHNFRGWKKEIGIGNRAFGRCLVDAPIDRTKSMSKNQHTRRNNTKKKAKKVSRRSRAINRR